MPTTRFSLHLVRSGTLVREAQALRRRVLAEAMDGRAIDPRSDIDQDWYDARCEHLVVRDVGADRAIATYRILPPEAALPIGGCSLDETFDLQALDLLRARMVEVSRFCVHAAYRTAGIEAMMWTRLGEYLLEQGHDYVVGCSSLGVSDGGHAAASMYRLAASRSSSPDDLRIIPRLALPLERLRDTLATPLPRLLQSWLENGAWVCGEPSWDRSFDCAHVPLLLPLARMRARSLRQFLAKAA